MLRIIDKPLLIESLPTWRIPENPSYLYQPKRKLLKIELTIKLKPISKYTNNGGMTPSSATITPTIDYLPLMAEFEVFGVRTNANPNEQTYQTQYEYYKSGNSKIKYKQNDVASAAAWWLRSPHYNFPSSFCFVITDETVSNGDADGSIGVAPAFLV